jgi:pimeloyl-ACP methyl ester carboxylesterase
VTRAALALLVVLAPGAASAAEAEAVSFETSDGFEIHADLTRAPDASAPVAVLLHMYRSDRTAWAPLVPELSKAGYHVLALDQRTHGRSLRRGDDELRVGGIPRRSFGPVLRETVRDIEGGIAYLRGRGIAADRVGVVGASYGCSVALLASRSVEGVAALVLLSPGTAYFDVDVTAAAAEWTGPLLAVAASDDLRAATSARALMSFHKGPEELMVFPSGGHGTRLFTPHPELAARIAEFLRERLAP